MEERTCDIIVLGGGPAGMTAAIYAKRANLDVVLLETNVTGGLVNSTYTVENFPSYPEIHGMELMEKMREHVDHMGVEVEEVFEVTGLELGEDEKAVHGDGIVYKAPAIILATGRKPIALDVPTECDQMHFCAICDGAPYKGKRVLVVGGGNSAFDEGLYLLNLGVAELTVVEIMDRFFAAEATQDALLGDPRVKGFKTTMSWTWKSRTASCPPPSSKTRRPANAPRCPWTGFSSSSASPRTTNGSRMRSPSMTRATSLRAKTCLPIFPACSARATSTTSRTARSPRRSATVP